MKIEETTEDKKILKFTTATLMFLLGSAISFTFTVTTIYNKFLFQEEQIQFLKLELTEFKSLINITLNEKTLTTNERIDKITKRIDERVTQLERPKSD